MTHVKQKQGAGTCGAVAYAAILGISELQAIRECKTKMRGRGAGTWHSNVLEAFEKRGIKAFYIDMKERPRISEAFWLEPLSAHFPLYVSVSERKNESTHAIAIANGMIYDGHNDGPAPIELYETRRIEYMIIVDKELPTYVNQP